MPMCQFKSQQLVWKLMRLNPCSL